MDERALRTHFIARAIAGRMRVSLFFRRGTFAQSGPTAAAPGVIARGAWMGGQRQPQRSFAVI